MRRAPNPAITPQLYRHFAIWTVMLTATVALFANGENEQAAAQAAQTSAIAREKPAKHAKPAFKVATDPAAGDTETWGSDDAGNFGHPTLSVPSSGSQRLPPPLAGIAGVPQPSEDDETDDAATAGATSPTAEQIAAAEAASRLRSGQGEEDSDGI